MKTRKEIDPSKIGLLGHSIGGVIVKQLAATASDVSFLILMASPGEKIIDMMAEQTAAYLQKVGLDSAATKAYVILYRQLALETGNSANGQDAKSKTVEMFDRWQKNTPPEIFKRLFVFQSPLDKDKITNGYVDSFFSKSWQQCIMINPENHLTKIRIPVLALNGSEDIQILADSNLNGIKWGLDKAGNRHS